MIAAIEPINPASPEGRDLAARLTGLLARIELEIAERKRRETTRSAA